VQRPADAEASRPRHPVHELPRGQGLVEVGDLDETLAAGELVDWVARARRLGVRWALHDDVVLLRRVHGANHSGSERARAGYLELARSAIRRSRGQS